MICDFQIETLHLVSKTPVSNSYLVKLFQPAFTFVKEVRFYTDIMDAIEEFQTHFKVPDEQKMDALIRCLGSRISLDSSKMINFCRMIKIGSEVCSFLKVQKMQIPMPFCSLRMSSYWDIITKIRENSTPRSHWPF